jgi:hypothetical protein
MKKGYLVLFIVIFSLFLISFVSAKDLYVATTGSDSNNGNFSNPFRTIANGINNLFAGDILYIRNGTYNEYELNNIPSGTENSPTTVKAYNNEKVIIDGKRDICSEDNIFNLQGKNYIIIDGITMTGFGIGFWGSSIFFGENADDSNIIIQNCEVYANQTCGTADNPALMVFSHCDNCILRNSKIYGINIINQVRCPSGVLVWGGTKNLTIENNEISDLSYSLFNKHGSSLGHLIRNNYFHDSATCIHLNSEYSLVENNLLVDCLSGIVVYYEAGREGGSNSKINHNTIKSYRGVGIILADDPTPENFFNCTVTNNLVLNSTGGDGRGTELTIAPYYNSQGDYNNYVNNHTFDYNLYYNPNNSKVITQYYDTPVLNLSEWKLLTCNTPLQGCQDQHSIQLQPIFIGGSSPTTIAGFALASNSPGYRTASDGGDIGANVSKVGINAGGSNPLTPYCGDTSCNNGETCSSCPQDCKTGCAPNVTTMQKLLNSFGNFKSGGSLSNYITKIKEFILG